MTRTLPVRGVPLLMLLAMALASIAFHVRSTGQQQAVEHGVRLSLDHESHLIGRLIRFIDEDFVALVSPRQLEQVSAEMQHWWALSSSSRAEAFDDELERLLEQRLGATFDAVRARVSTVGEWLYSSPTHYRLLAELGREMVGQGDLDRHITEQVRQQLLDESGLGDRLEADLAAAGMLHKRRLEQIAAGLQRFTDHRIRQLADAEGRLHQLEGVPDDPVTISAREVGPEALLVPSVPGLVAQPLSGALAAGLVTTATRRLAGSASVQGMRAYLAGSAGLRAGARAGGMGPGLSAAGTGAVVCGPLALVCGPAAGALVFGATWLATDLLWSGIDERLHRSDFEAALHRRIDAMQEHALAEVRTVMLAAFREDADELGQRHRDALRALASHHRRSPPSVVPIDRIRSR